jgi:pimeloyl-ACP methyl ester carboxylesterase
MQQRPLSLHVDDGGEGEAGRDGELPVVFLHSLAGTSRQWLPQLEHLRRSRRALALDLPGHGRSSAPESVRIPALADAVGRVLDELGIDRSVLVGHSAGAAVAIALAGRRANQVAGLLLLDPVGDQRRVPPDEMEPFLESLRSPDYEATIEAYWGSILVNADSTVAAGVLRDLRATSSETVIGVLEALLTYDPIADLGRYDGPVLSVITHLNQAPYSLHNLVDDLPVIAVDGTSHWPQLDRPAEVNRIVDEFLEAIH